MSTAGPHGAPAGGSGQSGGVGPGAGAGPGGAAPPTDEEVRAALEEQMRRLSVEDVLLQTVVTLVNLGARKLGLTASPDAPDAEQPAPDLEQARQAIEATRALLPLVSGDLDPIRDALSQLQVAYARAAQGAQRGPGTAGAESTRGAGDAGASAPGGPPGSGAAPSPGPGPGTAGEPGGSPAPDPERQKARSKIWTPPGV